MPLMFYGPRKLFLKDSHEITTLRVTVQSQESRINIQNQLYRDNEKNCLNASQIYTFNLLAAVNHTMLLAYNHGYIRNIPLTLVLLLLPTEGDIFYQLK